MTPPSRGEHPSPEDEVPPGGAITLDDAQEVPAAGRGSADGLAASPVAAGRKLTVRRGGDRLRSVASKYALIGVWIVLALFYSALMPHKFVGVSTIQAIFGSQSALLLLALAALCTFIVGEFDLSFASVMGLSATIVPVLTTLHHVSLPLGCLVAVFASLGCGILNAIFIVKLGVPSLVVTLGTASLFLGVAELISSATIVSVSSKTFSNIALINVAGLPLSFYYGLILCAGFAYGLAWMPLGRHVVFVGANREVARLAGINVDRIRAGSYILASFIAGLAGILRRFRPDRLGYVPVAGARSCVPRHGDRPPGSVQPDGHLLRHLLLGDGHPRPAAAWLHRVGARRVLWRRSGASGDDRLRRS